MTAGKEVVLKLYKTDSIDVPIGPPGSRAEFIDFDECIAVIRRQVRIFLIILLVSLCVGGAYLSVAKPFYSADILVLLDEDGDLASERRSESARDWAKIDPMRNSPYILTQMQLFTSNAVLDRVIDSLGLLKDPLFQDSNRSLQESLLNVRTKILIFLGIASDGRVAADADVARESARAGLLSALRVTRIGESSVVRVRYVSTDGDMSARIVNAIGDAYATDLLSARYDATRQTGSWLQAKIGELRQQALDSDMAVQAFRTEHDLLTTTDKETEEDSLISDQQLQELNKSLSAATSDVSYLRAQYDQIKRIVDSGRTDSEVTGTIRNYLSNDLRQRYLDAVRIEADLSRRFGPNHIQAVRERVTIDGYRKLMFEELQRVAQTYLSELTVAEARLANITDRVKKATEVTTLASQDKVQMRELERTAETYRRLYGAFLASYQQALQQQNIPVSRSRVVSSGRPPEAPNYPSKSLIMALFFMIGMIGGGSVAVRRENREKFFRNGAQVQERLGLTFLGTVPAIVKTDATKSLEPNPLLGSQAAFASYVLDNPFSDFAETLRSTKIAIDIAKSRSGAAVIGIVSTAPGEGKSTIAINFAKLLADQGKRVVLIDGDLRNPGATRALAPAATRGLLQALMEEGALGSTLIEDQRTGLKFLPAVIQHRVSHSADLLSSDRMQALLEGMKREVDYVVIDLPPLEALVDARAMEHLIDRFVFVVEWGGISEKAVLQAFDRAPMVIDKCVGAILSKVNMAKAKLYRRPDLLN
ncbi:AAA family ATPase [Rhizobium sp. PP-F2F-G48]|uniref:AAA family ATPase n=1 Tax=Rhizobium sp. PP-F2F-G48 TaxID=2135651 RepID=UPI00104A32B2